MSTTIDADAQGGILTIDQAAAYLSIPKATLYTWRTRRPGFGPRAVKLGDCLRYRRADLDAWVAEHVEKLDDFAAIPEQQVIDGVSLSRAAPGGVTTWDGDDLRRRSTPGAPSAPRAFARGPIARVPGSGTETA